MYIVYKMRFNERSRDEINSRVDEAGTLEIPRVELRTVSFRRREGLKSASTNVNSP